MADERVFLQITLASSVLSMAITVGLTALTLVNQMSVSDARARDENLKEFERRIQTANQDIKEITAKSNHLEHRTSQIGDDIEKRTADMMHILSDGRDNADRITRDMKNQSESILNYFDKKLSDLQRNISDQSDNIKREHSDRISAELSKARAESLMKFESDVKSTEGRIRDSIKSTEENIRLESKSINEKLGMLKSIHEESERSLKASRVFIENYQIKIDHAVQSSVNRHMTEQHQFMMSLLAATLSRSLRTEAPGDSGIDEHSGANILIGSANDEALSLNDFKLEMLPSGSGICGDKKHEHIFKKLQDASGLKIKYSKKHFALAIEQIGKLQEKDGAKCDYVFGSLSDSIKSDSIRKIFGPHVKTRFIPSVP